MIIKGKYNEAKVFTDVIAEGAEEQVREMCDNEIFTGSRIRIMPDVHSGAGCTIGTTMTIRDKVIPDMVGVDIGCGMEVTLIKERSVDLAALDEAVYASIPSGMEIRSEPHEYADMADLADLRCREKIDVRRAQLSIGTLGGGNHFIELDRDDDGRLYLVIHSGSRHLGTEVAGYYREAACRRLARNDRRSTEELIARLKAEGREREIQKELLAAFERRSPVPADKAYVSDDLFDDYIHDMKIVQAFASLNRRAMTETLLRVLGLTAEENFTTIHNYIDTDCMILRKGAVSAKKGERLLIPINMRDGSLICTGKGNEDWNYSAPHGAGRLMSRTKAFETLSVEEFRRSMAGIYSTSVGEKTLDESPMAYKKMEDIMDNIALTVDIEKVIRPVYNFKASG